MKKKVRTFDDFFRALKTARKRGFEFSLLRRSGIAIRQTGKRGFVMSEPIYHKSDCGSYWSPVSVVAMAFYCKSKKDPIPSWASGAGAIIGLDIEDTLELIMAAHEKDGHDPELRARMLKACGLTETPHSKRPKVRYEEHRGL
jgi:hypothetical protein